MYLTEEEIRARLKASVKRAGGGLKFLRKHKLYGLDQVHHMFDSGTAVLTDGVLHALGFTKCTMYRSADEPVSLPQQAAE